MNEIQKLKRKNTVSKRENALKKILRECVCERKRQRVRDK